MNLNERWSALESQGLPGVSQRVKPLGIAQYLGIDSTGNRSFFTLSKIEPKSWSQAGPINVVKKFLEGTDDWFLGMVLTDRAFIHEFSFLCEDLIEKVEGVEDESKALEIQQQAYEDWMEFFRRNRALGAEGIRGLFCELEFMRRNLETGVDQTQLIASWMGPFGAPQDYVFPNFHAVEIKSLQPSINRIRIANENQLAFDGELDLQVFRLQEVTSLNSGLSLDELISVVQENLQSETLKEFQLRLAKAGYTKTNPLNESLRFVVGDFWIFSANKAGFPKVVPSTLPMGVSNVKYEISLASISGFMKEPNGSL